MFTTGQEITVCIKECTEISSSSPNRTVIHYLQEAVSGRFCKYDFGSREKNLAEYNRTEPPQYSLSKVNVPVALMWSDNDALADPKVINLNISV